MSQIVAPFRRRLWRDHDDDGRIWKGPSTSSDSALTSERAESGVSDVPVVGKLARSDCFESPFGNWKKIDFKIVFYLRGRP